MSYQDDPQVQAMLDHLPEKTGKDLEGWYAVLSASGLTRHGEMLKLLKTEYGVTHGYANTLALLYRQQAEGGPPAENELIEAQFSGPRAAMRPVYDAVLSAARKLGSEVEIAPKKTYVSLRRKKQFAIVQVSTKARVDLGLNLKGVEAGGRLEGGVVFSGMCTHKIRLGAPGEVDPQVIGWLRQAYDQA
jgi:predicted transport protein